MVVVEEKLWTPSGVGMTGKEILAHMNEDRLLTGGVPSVRVVGYLDQLTDWKSLR